MLEMRPLELSDRPMVEDYLRRYPPEISELTFTNLFVWRHSRPVFLAEVEDALVFVTTAEENGNSERFILGHPVGKASPLRVVNALGVDVAGFIRIPEDRAATLRDSSLLITPDRDNWDYVYRVADLAELAGRHYHKKRNLIKQCLSAYRCEYEPMTAEILGEYSDMQDRWCEARQCKVDRGLCREYVAIRNMFDNFSELELVGGAIRVDGTIEAYAVGEALGPATAVCHFEKAMPGFRGLGQLVNQWFAKYGLKGFEFENREQDLGIAGLRQAKESYYPHHMVEKHSAWFSAARATMPAPADPHECARHGVDEE
ncbi:MAG: phosphatidylglycerol lysyltransferase domain-containing protein [Thermodesulfobacteriota bacterium]|nr:phosphatidylglycerol lysyltransferase domain-containing protein [Thermodesulfobacteriota bacterium]